MTEPNGRPARPLIGRGSYGEALRIGEILRKETVGGALLVIAAAIAIIWANSPAAESYFALRDFKVGYEPWHLELSLGAWAADGLLAVFFFLVGLELKREFVVGDLRQPRAQEGRRPGGRGRRRSDRPGGHFRRHQLGRRRSRPRLGRADRH
jgi:NhaA family Na+:H+ antiporter